MEKIIIDNLEVWPEVIGKLNWHAAIAKMEELGPGWRLPTLDELNHTLRPNRYKIFGEDTQFHGKWYSSSTPGDTNNHWVVDFGDSYSNYFHDENPFYILPVRDFTGEIALDYLLKEF